MKLLTTLSLIAALPPFHTKHLVTGEASWYGREHRGRTMANGAPFDERYLTCASWFFPLGSELRVTCVATGRSVYVTNCDRGPAWRLVFHRNRVIDLSRSAFDKIANLNLGHVMVKIEVVEKYKVPVIKVVDGMVNL